ncbi:MAG: DUF4373 domain-containing protein [Saccharofermentanales bacterium]|nr:DUF4373 domain-containing protein [Clostridiales bacterium]
MSIFESYYLIHDVDAFTDHKIIKLRMKFGLEGYGLYWAILEMLFCADGYILPCDEDGLNAIAFHTQCGGNADAMLKQYVSYATEIGLFEMDENGKTFWSPSLIRRMQRLDEQAEKRSIDARNAANVRWKKESEKLESTDNTASNATAMRPQCEGNATGDATAMRNHANKIREDKIREDKTIYPSFDDFWSIYPKKVGKKAALKAWEKLRPSKELQERIISAVEQQKKSEQWTTENGRFIPNPATWINQGRWDDELAMPKGNGRASKGTARTSNRGNYEGADTFVDYNAAFGLQYPKIREEKS